MSEGSALLRVFLFKAVMTRSAKSNRGARAIAGTADSSQQSLLEPAPTGAMAFLQAHPGFWFWHVSGRLQHGIVDWVHGVLAAGPVHVLSGVPLQVPQGVSALSQS